MKIFQKLLLFAAAINLNSAAAPFEDSMAQRMQACTGCHGAQGRAGPDGYYPRLAGKPAGYLYNQLLNIRDGRRHYALMAGLLAPLDEPYLMAMAQYFSGLEVPYPSPVASMASPERMARGRALVTQGDPARDLPPCQQCHGEALTGAEPHVPGLLGLPRDYLNAQLGGWRTGQRRAQEPDCMHDIANRLSSQDVAAVTHWLAAQTVPANSQPLAALPPLKTGAKALRCGSADVPMPVAEKTISTPSAQVAQGAYLARVGNCEHCHTAPGGKPYAGQRAITTPFGTAYSTNLTPEQTTGLGHWTSNDFWQAMHHGKSKDGRLLSPAFPYTSYTAMSRADADALFSFLQSLRPENQPHRGHDMRWPFGTQTALFAWRTLFFSPRDFQADAAQSAAWNRGAYLVNTLGHCGECHTPRNRLGATQADLALHGGLIPEQGWLAPSLLSSTTNTNTQRLTDTLSLLKTGHSFSATASGPMAQVVQGSTQHLNEADLQAMGAYLQSLTQAQDPSQSKVAADRKPAARTMAPAAMTRGAGLYTNHCAACHGPQGQGVAGAYPALAGNRAVLLADAGNLIQATLHGGFAPVTQANPHPYGMPPFMLTLGDGDIALVVSYIRQAWGNPAPPVTESDVSRLRERQASR
jgi:cytochrome c553